MSQITLKAPLYNSQELNTGDGTERGDSPKKVVDSINTMMAELYAVNAQAGTTVVDFGAFPGALDTTAAVTGLTGIVAGSIVDVRIVATATADHSIDEHWVDPPIVTAGNIVAGTGFTIYAITRDGARDYGQWTVQWAWQ